jgi:adenosylcobinamide kinase/adenosylcobinamide-phosphate guanylyltransferase
LITFLTGGARSGKSSVAVSMASRTGGPVRYIATARAEDEEMERRIEEHRRHRPDGWVVVEVPLEMTEAISSATEEETILIDCITLWISNLMLERTDGEILAEVDRLLDMLTARRAATIVVSNEVGSGLVPMDPIGRRFRDIHGRANQRVASVADEAYLVVAGRLLPLT